MVKKTKIYNRFDTPKVKPFETTGESLTQQSHQKQTDIHYILSQYRNTGQIPNIAQGQQMYGDFASVPEYSEALNLVIEAENSFASLPAKVRAQFNNNVEDFLRFAENPDNIPELIDLGLVPDENITEDMRARVEARNKSSQPKVSSELKRDAEEATEPQTKPVNPKGDGGA